MATALLASRAALTAAAAEAPASHGTDTLASVVVDCWWCRTTPQMGRVTEKPRQRRDGKTEENRNRMPKGQGQEGLEMKSVPFGKLQRSSTRNNRPRQQHNCEQEEDEDEGRMTHSPDSTMVRFDKPGVPTMWTTYNLREWCVLPLACDSGGAPLAERAPPYSRNGRGPPRSPALQTVQHVGGDGRTLDLLCSSVCRRPTVDTSTAVYLLPGSW